MYWSSKERWCGGFHVCKTLQTSGGAARYNAWGVCAVEGLGLCFFFTMPKAHLQNSKLVTKCGLPPALKEQKETKYKWFDFPHWKWRKRQVPTSVSLQCWESILEAGALPMSNIPRPHSFSFRISLFQIYVNPSLALCVCVLKPEVNLRSNSSVCYPSCFWDRVSHWPRPCWPTRPAGQWVPGIHLPLPLKQWDDKQHYHHSWIFYFSSMHCFELRSSDLCGKYITNWAIFPVSVWIFLMAKSFVSLNSEKLSQGTGTHVFIWIESWQMLL